jgi:hypothetical protein
MTEHREHTFDVSEIRDMVRTIKQGGSLSSSMEEKEVMRMHLAVVRWVNMLGPGDVEAEYALVKGAMSGI